MVSPLRRNLMIFFIIDIIIINSRRFLYIEHGTFTQLLQGGMGKECLRYHSRLADFIAIKKGERYTQTISWLRAKTSFSLLRSAGRLPYVARRLPHWLPVRQRIHYKILLFYVQDHPREIASLLARANFN